MCSWGSPAHCSGRARAYRSADWRSERLRGRRKGWPECGRFGTRSFLDVAIDHVDHLVARERLPHPGVGAGTGKHLFERFLGKVGDEHDRNVLLVRLGLEDFAETIS